jgi:hypothetical protein
MALPVQQFQPVSPEQSSSLAGLVQLFQNAQAMQQQNTYRPKTLQAQLEQLQAQTQHQNLENEYYPKEMNIRAQNAYTSAGQLGQSQSRFNNPAYIAKQIISTPAGMSLYRSNKEFASAVDRINAGSASDEDYKIFQRHSGINPNSPQASNFLPGFARDFGVPIEPQQPIVAPQNTPQQDVPQPSQPLSKQEYINLSDQIKNQIANSASGIPITDDQTAQNQDVMGSYIEAKTVPAATRQQRTYAASVDNMVKQVDADMPSIVKYAGLMGKTNAEREKWMASMGLTPSEEYAKLNNWVSVQMPALAKEIGRDTGMQATDNANFILKELADPIKWKSNPELALSQWNALKNMLANNAQALSMSQAGLQKRVQDIGNQSFPTDLKSQVKQMNGKTGSAGWFTDSNGNLMYRSKDGNIYSEQEIG